MSAFDPKQTLQVLRSSLDLWPTSAAWVRIEAFEHSPGGSVQIANEYSTGCHALRPAQLTGNGVTGQVHIKSLTKVEQRSRSKAKPRLRKVINNSFNPVAAV